MKDLIREAIAAAAVGLRDETDRGIRVRLEALYMQAVEDSTAVLKKMIEGLERTATRNASDYARLVDVLVDAQKFSDEELAMLRTWFAEFSDSSVLKFQQSNPAVYDSVISKITQVKKQNEVAA